MGRSEAEAWDAPHLPDSARSSRLISADGREAEPKPKKEVYEMKGSLICVTVKVRTSVTSWRTKITAPSITRALELAGDGKPGRRVRVVFPIDPEELFAGTSTETTVRVPETAQAA